MIWLWDFLWDSVQENPLQIVRTDVLQTQGMIDLLYRQALSTEEEVEWDPTGLLTVLQILREDSQMGACHPTELMHPLTWSMNLFQLEVISVWIQLNVVQNQNLKVVQVFE